MRTKVIVLAGLLAACGSDPGDDPIPSTPLAGELNGMPWMAGGATSRPASDPGERVVEIHPNADHACGDFGDEPYVGIVLPWTVGSQSLGFESDATVFIFFDATAHLVLEGRIEVLDASNEVGASVPFRIRAIFQDDDDDLFVEGEVQVQICQ